MKKIGKAISRKRVIKLANETLYNAERERGEIAHKEYVQGLDDFETCVNEAIESLQNCNLLTKQKEICKNKLEEALWWYLYGAGASSLANVNRGLLIDVIVKKEKNGGYSVNAPILPGATSQGETIEESLEMIKDSLVTLIESYEVSDKEIPWNHDYKKSNKNTYKVII